MNNEEKDMRDILISTQLCAKLANHSPSHAQFSIFRVPDQLRKVKENAYEPYLVSIGPYHHGKPQLQGMEKYKLHFLRQRLNRRKNGRRKIDENMLKCVQAMRALEKQARECYQESSSFDHLDSDKIVEMMILDGCFIIELFCSGSTHLFLPIILHSIRRDLLLLENQLPFFVLLELFDLTKLPNQKRNDLIQLLTIYLKRLSNMGFINVKDALSNETLFRSKHLLDLIHKIWFPRHLRTSGINHMTEWESSKFIRCATELREAGIKFEKVSNEADQNQQRNLFEKVINGIKFKKVINGADKNQRRDLFDVRFDDGTMEIPTLTIEDDTETFLRNMIAYEQLSAADNGCYVTDYMVLMDCLIDSKKDAQLLCSSRIINNHLGDDEVIATLFNKLGDQVTLSCPDFLYSELFGKVYEHCSRKRNKWMAKLRHDYFNSPWAWISFLAAVVLLLLTFFQTLYAAITYYD